MKTIILSGQQITELLRKNKIGLFPLGFTLVEGEELEIHVEPFLSGKKPRLDGKGKTVTPGYYWADWVEGGDEQPIYLGHNGKVQHMGSVLIGELALPTAWRFIRKLE